MSTEKNECAEKIDNILELLKGENFSSAKYILEIAIKKLNVKAIVS